MRHAITFPSSPLPGAGNFGAHGRPSESRPWPRYGRGLALCCRASRKAIVYCSN